MASAKRASEGILMLSMYDDEDDEMESIDEHQEEMEPGKESVPPSADAVVIKDANDEGFLVIRSVTENQDDRMQKQEFFRPESDSLQVGKRRTTIVDYGHEEGVLSPEPEDAETQEAAQLIHGEELQTTDDQQLQKKSPVTAQLSTSGNQVTSPQFLDQNELPEADALVNNLESAPTEDVVMACDEDKKDADLLAKFLPPPPSAKCSQEVQDKIIKFIALKKNTGRNFNSEVRNRKEYRNPDFLLHAMTYQNIDQIGSCFPKDVFDPHGYDESDFYDEIEADMKREMERKEQERKKSQKIDFSSAGIQSLNVIPTPKIVLPTPTSLPSASSAPVSLSNAPPPNPDSTTRDGRPNKKSKWDKVDPDPKTCPSTGEQEIYTKTGGGYAAYARQRRRDSEENRATDKKADRKS